MDKTKLGFRHVGLAMAAADLAKLDKNVASQIEGLPDDLLTATYHASIRLYDNLSQAKGELAQIIAAVKERL